MIGIFVGPLTSLPVEALLLWVSSTWCAVILYESIQVVLRLKLAGVESVLSRRESSPAP
jgi:hypothetical protein